MLKVEVILPKKALADKAKIMASLQQAVQDTVTEGHRFIAEYPPQVLTKTGYVRTGTLKRSWSSETHSGGNRIEGIVGSSSNIAPYNEEVQGAMGEQSPMFRGAGWQGVADLKEKMEKELGGRIDKNLKEALG